MELNESIIPKGHYCYTQDGNKEVTTCPYFSSLSIYDELGEISIPWCILLGQGSMANWWNDEEFERLLKYFDITEDEAWDNDGILGLSLLWDQCKECGINYDDEEFD